MLEFFPGVVGFQCDSGNTEKNWQQHDVTQAECEQLFFNRPLLAAGDPKHSAAELRYFVLGRTDLDRELMVVFTVRGSLLRVISARPMSRSERRVYAQGTLVSRFRPFLPRQRNVRSGRAMTQVVTSTGRRADGLPSPISSPQRKPFRSGFPPRSLPT